jgi:hypothetical protein
MQSLITRTLISLCLAAATTALAFAQTPKPSAGAPAASPGASAATPSLRQHPRRVFANPTDRIEARLAYIRTALKITDAQTPQWNAYADLVRRIARDTEQRIQSFRSQMQSRTQRPTVIERLERQQSFLSAAVTRLNELLAVEKPLYAVLTPEQQRVADEVLAPRPRATFRERGVRRGHAQGMFGHFR